MVKVYYNGIDAFSGIAATPFIAINDEIINYAQRWGVVQNISLNGMITGECDNSFNDIIDKQTRLFDNFSSDFKEFKIIDNEEIAFSGNYVKIQNIDFDQSAYIRTADFKIDLQVYPESLFSGTFGVLDPVSEIKYAEQQDGTVNITRSFSAKGFNTSSAANNALHNARAYVQSMTGSAADIVTPKFISIYPSLTGLSPRKISENINRMESTYGIDIDYILRKGACTDSLFKYTVDINYDQEKGVYSVSLKGSLNGGEFKTIDQLRSELSTLNAFDLAFYEFNKVTNYGYLNPQPESFSINENAPDAIIDFTYEYTTDPQKVKFDYTVDINNEYITDQVTVNLNGTFVARGPQKLRLQKLEQELAAFNPIPLCQKYYIENIENASLPLNTNAKNYKVNRDLTQSTIAVQASFDNSQMPPSGFKSFTWNISVNPSINRYTPIQFLDGGNGYFDLNYYNRGKITLQGSAIVDNSGDYSSLTREEAGKILEQYAGQFTRRVKVEDKVERRLKAEENGYIYNFTLSETCETPIFSIQ